MRLMAVVAILCGVSAAAFGAERDAAEKLMRDGDAKMRGGDNVGAVAAYRGAIEKDPQYAAPHGRIGVAFLEAGQKADALGAFEKYLALETRPEERRVVEQAKRIVAELKRDLGKAPAPTPTPTVAPTGSATPTPAGRTSSAAPSPARASASAVLAPSEAPTTATPVGPSSRVSDTDNGDKLFHRREFKRAAAAYRRDATALPNVPALLYKLAAALTATGAWQEALDAWNEVLKREPKNEAARLYADRVAEKAHKANEASVGSVGETLKKAAAALKDGAHALALTLADATLALDRFLAEAHIVRARALIALGRADEGITAVRRALAASPRESRALFILGDAYRANGDKERAVSAFERYLSVVDANDPLHKNDAAFARRFVKAR